MVINTDSLDLSRCLYYPVSRLVFSDMDNFFLYIHLICSLYLFFTEILFTGYMTALTAFCTLVYLIMIILPATVKSKPVRTALHLVQFPAIGLAALYFPGIVLLLPLHITRTLALFSLPVIIEAAACLLPLLIIRREIYPVYLFFTILTFLVYKIFSRYTARARERELRIDHLESENQHLGRRISRMEESDRERAFLVKLEERNRIAQKLHDDLGHTITGSLVQLQAVNTIINDDPQRAQQMITGISAVLNNGMDSLRQGLKSLKPGTAQLGIQYLRKLLADFEKDSGLRTHIKVEGDLFIIDPVLWQTISINLKEALTNILKHSGASEIFFEITVLNKIIKIAVRDNGLGTSAVTPGMGLIGMEERMTAAGGTLILDGSDGFSVIMLFKKGA